MFTSSFGQKCAVDGVQSIYSSLGANIEGDEGESAFTKKILLFDVCTFSGVNILSYIYLLRSSILEIFLFSSQRIGLSLACCSIIKDGIPVASLGWGRFLGKHFETCNVRRISTYLHILGLPKVRR